MWRRMTLSGTSRSSLGQGTRRSGSFSRKAKMPVLRSSRTGTFCETFFAVVSAAPRARRRPGPHGDDGTTSIDRMAAGMPCVPELARGLGQRPCLFGHPVMIVLGDRHHQIGHPRHRTEAVRAFVTTGPREAFLNSAAAAHRVTLPGSSCTVRRHTTRLETVRVPRAVAEPPDSTGSHCAFFHTTGVGEGRSPGSARGPRSQQL